VDCLLTPVPGIAASKRADRAKNGIALPGERRKSQRISNNTLLTNCKNKK
jgi:hypothetical protein